MKKILILSGGIIVALISGFALYKTFFSGSSFSSVNIHLGAVDGKAAVRLCQSMYTQQGYKFGFCRKHAR